MRVLVLLLLPLLRSVAAAEEKSLCDAGLCSCDRTWGKFNCSCTAMQDKELVLSPAVMTESTASLRIENCSRVRVMSRTWENHREVRHLDFINIGELVIENYAFSWNETLALEPIPQPGLVVSIINSSIPEIPSYSFKGRLTGIILRNVTIGTVRAFAFASLYHTEKLELTDCTVHNYEAQAFKKFSLDKLHINGGHFSGNVPSRTMVDIEVRSDLIIEKVFINNIRSFAFIIHGPKIFRLQDTHIDNIEGEAFYIVMHGKVTIQNNVFQKLSKGAFLRISVDGFTLKMKDRQAMNFENNTINNFEEGCLAFNRSSFKPLLDHILLNETCSCVLLESWNSQLSFHPTHHDSVPQTDLSDAFWCRKDESIKYGEKYIHFQDFSQQCVLSTGAHVFLIVIITCSLALVAVILIVIFFCYRWRSRHQRRWINVPTTPNNQTKKAKTNNVSGVKGQDSKIAMVVPDGRTYRETELHVIVERTEPIAEHEFVDMTVDERAMKNRQ